jgi:hypothetical protein
MDPIIKVIEDLSQAKDQEGNTSDLRLRPRRPQDPDQQAQKSPPGVDRNVSDRRQATSQDRKNNNRMDASRCRSHLRQRTRPHPIHTLHRRHQRAHPYRSRTPKIRRRHPHRHSVLELPLKKKNFLIILKKII